jgi:hypothetical protein
VDVSACVVVVVAAVEVDSVMHLVFAADIVLVGYMLAVVPIVEKMASELVAEGIPVVIALVLTNPNQAEKVV